VVVFDDDTPARIIELLHPDVLVKGGDYTEESIVGAPFVKAKGGRVAIIPLVAGRATTAVVQKIRSLG
jgi:D-beta-D-heptose 7-phosphate kinase/D-beta-D-heptose 1-phosphate adenosyltransferase